MQCTSTSHRRRNCATSSVTCTPAPPYTSGGYSRVIIATRILGTLARRRRGPPATRAGAGPSNPVGDDEARQRPEEEPGHRTPSLWFAFVAGRQSLRRTESNTLTDSPSTRAIKRLRWQGLRAADRFKP